jgi:hypothetical protein
MRQAITATVKYLLGFIALAVFGYLAFGSGPTSDAKFVHAFKVAGIVAVVEVTILMFRPAPVDRLIFGANLWLIVGGSAALLKQWWVLRIYEDFDAVSMFATMLGVGIVSTAFSRAGFVGKLGHRAKVLRASLILTGAVAIALLSAIKFRGDVKYAAIFPMIALSWLSRLLRTSVSDEA